MVRARCDADDKWACQTGDTDGSTDADVQFHFDRGIEQFPCGLASTKKASTGRTLELCDRRRDSHSLRGLLHEGKRAHSIVFSTLYIRVISHPMRWNQ